MARAISRRTGDPFGEYGEPRRRSRENTRQTDRDQSRAVNRARLDTSRHRIAVLRSRTALIGVGLADTLARARGMLTGLVHRAFLLIRTAGHALLRGSKPTLALGDVSCSEHQDHQERRKTAYEPQHLPRMLKPAP